MAEEKDTIQTQNEIATDAPHSEEPLKKKRASRKKQVKPPAEETAAEETAAEEATVSEDEFYHIPTTLFLDEEPTAPEEETDEHHDTEEPISPEEDEGGFLIVEHFADYERRTLDETAPDEAAEDQGAPTEEDAEDEALAEEEGVPSEDYENLTILDAVQEEKPRDRVRDKYITAPDDVPFSPEKQRGVDNRFDIIELFVFTLTVILLITTFFFKHSVVQGSSMVDTLHDGDHLIISDFLYEPKQYDVVVVQDKNAYSHGPMVKRVIALGGQTVRLERRLDKSRSSSTSSYFTTAVYVDGTPIRSDFVYQSGSDNVRIDFDDEEFELLAADIYHGEYFIFEYKVPEGEIFVLGDHRNNSTDSREFGSLSEETILGKVLLRIYPFADFGAIED